MSHRVLAATTFLLAAAACLAHAEPLAQPPGQPPTKSAAPASPEGKVLALVNRYRAATGLPAVVVDAALSRGCMEHAEYMRLNRNSDAMAGLNAHHQRPGLPGATLAGAACGKAADLFPGVSDLEIAVDGWMASLYHRRPILDPSLEKIGVGYSKLDDGSLMAALMFVNGKGGADKSERWPVLYPADKQADVALEFGNEIPNPIPGNGRGGYPVTLQFPAFEKVTGVKAKLVDGGGKPVPFWLSDPEHPATSFGQYGVVCVIPKAPLRPQSTYRVEIEATWRGKTATWSWSFSTLSLRRVDAGNEAAIGAAIGIASLVRGEIKYGGMMDTETAFLMIGPRPGTKYKMISVLVPRAVWQELSRGTTGFDAFTGKTIEVEATPQLVQNTYLNLPIAQAHQLRVLP
ncbi:MAG: CAP domain-containing protein [Deltaproteobacteria bacterium]|nr:CAP domain-containing protein [Deltaproteobacteria bacterium]